MTVFGNQHAFVKMPNFIEPVPSNGNRTNLRRAECKCERLFHKICAIQGKFKAISEEKVDVVAGACKYAAAQMHTDVVRWQVAGQNLQTVWSPDIIGVQKGYPLPTRSGI